MTKKHWTVSRDDDFDDLDEDVEFERGDIYEWCGQRTADKGLALLAQGAITKRSFDGTRIRATVQQGERQLPLLFDCDDFSNICSDVDHARRTNPFCEHIAALLFAFLDEPETFVPRNTGEVLELVQNDPGLAQDLGLDRAQLEAAVTALNQASPAEQTAFAQLPVDAGPAHVAAAREPSTPREVIKRLLRGLSLEQLRAISQRRHWSVSTTPKEHVVEQLAAALGETPLPAGLTAEEESLLRIENTLHGLEWVATHEGLMRDWKKHGGGDRARLERAINGLQVAGVLFPITLERSPLHYQWSPVIRPGTAPLLPLKVKYYPPDKAGRLAKSTPLPPAALIADAILQEAARTGLAGRQYPRDARLAEWAGPPGWPFEPTEVGPLARGRGYSAESAVLTVPLRSFWSEETERHLGDLAGGMSEEAGWLATTLLALGLVQSTTPPQYGVAPELVRAWQERGPEQQQRRVLAAWRQGAAPFDELASRPAGLVFKRSLAYRDFTPDILRDEISMARGLILRILATLEPLTWYSCKSFVELIRDQCDDFLHPMTSTEVWFLAAAKTMHVYRASHARDWEAAYRPVLLAMLEGPLRWTGVLDLAYEGKELTALQVTALGAWLCKPPDAGPFPGWGNPDAAGAEPIRWLNEATFRLSATPEAMRLMAPARRFAEPASELLTFRVTYASVARGLEQGLQVPEVVAQFAEMGAPMPAVLQARLEKLAANYGRVRLYEQLTVLELADDMALRELLAGTSLQRYVIHQFSPRLVVVRDEGVDELVGELIKKGYTPRVVAATDGQHGG